MDWIERLVGLAPDGGDGSVERALAVGAVAVLVVVSGRWWWGRAALRVIIRWAHRASPAGTSY